MVNINITTYIGTYTEPSTFKLVHKQIHKFIIIPSIKGLSKTYQSFNDNLGC